jgi:uncharacterized lipoprotein YddW (UPF0748 family)
MNKILLLSFFACFFAAAKAQNPPKREMRGAWIATFSNIDWPNKTQTPNQQRSALITILNHHQATGINLIYLQVRSQCDALYKSTLEPWSADLTGTQGTAPSDPGWDPLEFAVTEAHKRGMELHAWINPYRAVATASKLPTFSEEHVARQHPEWLLNNGTTITLNPGLAAVRDHIMSVIADITQRYDVDGIHFDDYFYPGAPFNDDAAYNADPRGFPATTAGRADWRRDNVNLLIKRVYETVTAIKPWIKFGVSPSGIYRSSTNPAIGSNTSSGALQHYSAVYADSKKWLQQGWVDYIEPQVYWYKGQTGSDYNVLIPWWNNQANGRHIYIGMAGYKVGTTGGWTSRSEIPNQVRMNRDAAYPNIYGQAMYNTNSLRSNALNFRDSLRLRFYQKPALQPAMPWRDATAPEAPTALSAVKYGNDSVVLDWTKPSFTTNELDKAKRFVIYRSENPAIDMNDANNILFITYNDTTAFSDASIEPYTTYYYAVSSIDRFHNESSPSNTAANIPPSITCPGNQFISLDAACTAVMPDFRDSAVINDGAASSSPVTVTQSPEPGSVISGSSPSLVTITAMDKGGNSAACSFTLTAQDLLAPVITAVTVDPAVLEVPNHKMRMVTVGYETADNCGPVTPSLSVTSNEPVDGEPDWEIIDEHRLKLRAERLGTGTGRVYTITIRATDASGNSAAQDITVAVPHDNGSLVVSSASRQAHNPIVQDGWTVNVVSNPSVNQFTVITQSNTAALLSMKVVDNTGRVIESRRGLSANGAICLGSHYRPGIYFVELAQGDQKQTLKLVKAGK